MADDFPKTCPEVECETYVYHPNIDPTNEDYNNICLNLFDEWNPNFGLRDVVQGLLFLFYNPNVDDPLSPLFDGSLTEEEFEENVKTSLRGGEVDDYDFTWNYYGTDPEMLKHKPETADQNKKEDKEQTGEVSTEVTPESKADESTATESANTNDGEREETEPQDLTVILEKVSTLMDNCADEEEEKEDTVKESDPQPNGTNDDNTAAETEANADGDISEQAVQGSSAEANVDDIIAEEIPTHSPMQRQTSKVERQSSAMESEVLVANGDVANGAVIQEMSSTGRNFVPQNVFGTCTMTAPEVSLAVNMVVAACYFTYKAFVT